jgi:hypothetical protein
MGKNNRLFDRMPIKGYLFVLPIVLAFTSCLKNSPYNVDFSQGGASVDLPLAAANANGIVSFSYGATVTTTMIPVYVNVASPAVPNKSTTATLALDTAFFNSFNAANGGGFSVLPDSVYSVPTWNVTIPEGQRLDSIPVTYDFSKMDLSQNYILPITIAQASLPIEQWNHLLIYVSVKNQYDGIYSLKGYTLRAGDATRTGNFGGMTMPLITAGPTSVTFGSLQPWADGSGVSIGNPLLSFSTAGAAPYPVTITSPGGAYNDPSYSSVYDPSTLTFYISFTWGAGPASRLATDTLTYQGPRP